MVEINSDEILKDADVEDVALLVAGDPFAATTHTDLILRARHKNIKTKIVHNASIFNAVGCCGLQVSKAHTGQFSDTAFFLFLNGCTTVFRI